MIGGVLCKMREADTSIDIDDEYPGKLADIAFGDTNMMSPGQGRQALHCHADRKQGFGGCLLELEGLKKPFLRIGYHRER